VEVVDIWHRNSSCLKEHIVLHQIFGHWYVWGSS
jgi:hypothetical protein